MEETACYNGESLERSNIVPGSPDKIVIMQLDHDELMNILSKPAEPVSLLERLRSDYPSTIRHNKTKRKTCIRGYSRRK